MNPGPLPEALGVRRSALRLFALFVAAALFAHIPFLTQAYHIDDTYFLYIARQILVDPLHPLSAVINWNGTPMKMYDYSGDAAFFEYYRALVTLLFGEAEAVQHAAMIPCTVLALIATYLLGRRFTTQPVLAALLVLATPAFFVMSHTVMLDVPMLAFFLLAVASFIYGFDADRRGLLIAGGVLIAVTSLCKYSGLMLIPLLLAYTLLKRGRWDNRALYLAIPIVIMGVYFLTNLFQYGEIHIFKASKIIIRQNAFSLFPLVLKGSAVLLYLGGVFIFPFSLPVLLRKAMSAWEFIAIAVVAAAAAVTAEVAMHYNFASSLLIFLFLGNGIGLVYLLFRERVAGFVRNGIGNIERRRDDIFLALWIAGVAVLNLIIVFTAARHVLPLAAPLVLLFFRLCEEKRIFPTERARRSFYAATIGATFLLSFVVSCADRDYAEVYRNFTVTHKEQLRAKGRTVWFAGHWGFQYYMERLGCVPLGATGPQPKAKDIVIGPLFPYCQPITREFGERLRYRADYLYPSRIPVRTMFGGSGFYSHWLGLLPYSIFNGPLEHFTVFEVE